MGYTVIDLHVKDVDAAIAYYCDVLGFTFKDKAALEGEPPFWGWVELGGCQVMFGSLESAYKGEFAKPQAFREALEQNKLGVGVAVNFRDVVPDIDAYYEHVKAKGAKFEQELHNASYGWRIFVVEDLNGYRLSFSEDVKQ